MRYREAAEHDIEIIQKIRNSVNENKLTDPKSIRDQDVLLYIQKKGKGWVAEDEHGVCAFAIVSLEDSMLWALFVHPSYEGQGIGKELLSLGVSYYFAQKKKPLWLRTGKDTKAYAFYKKQGWISLGNYGKHEEKMQLSLDDWQKKGPVQGQS